MSFAVVNAQWGAANPVPAAQSFIDGITDRADSIMNFFPVVAMVGDNGKAAQRNLGNEFPYYGSNGIGMDISSVDISIDFSRSPAGAKSTEPGRVPAVVLASLSFGAGGIVRLAEIMVKLQHHVITFAWNEIQTLNALKLSWACTF